MKIYIKNNRTSLHSWEKNYCSIFGLNQTFSSADAQSLVISQSFEPSWVNLFKIRTAAKKQLRKKVQDKIKLIFGFCL